MGLWSRAQANMDVSDGGQRKCGPQHVARDMSSGDQFKIQGVDKEKRITWLLDCGCLAAGCWALG
jgi:hypothetical protein